jgi:subtilase family serine protease
MQIVVRGRSGQRMPMLIVVILLVSSFLPLIPVHGIGINGFEHRIGAAISETLRHGHYARWTRANPPTDDSCRANGGTPCYSPQEMRNAYSAGPLIGSGYTGRGQTIVIIESYGSPTTLQDLQTFDKDYGLPDPPSFEQLAPIGSVPFDASNSDMAGWAEETALDVQWAHAMAPGASLVVLTSPISETQGLQGMPEFLQLEMYALSHHLGNIISQSWGTTENTLFTPEGEKILDGFNAAYQIAAQMNISVFASSGDTGSANPDSNGKNYAFPTVGFPASSPWVTAVGGTSLYADTNGNYQHETAWDKRPDGGASGGGVSAYFPMPDYQQAYLSAADQGLIHGHRGLPDVAYNADPATSIPVYIGFLPPAQVGYYLFGGTSAGTPQWSGLIADANQLLGHPLGFLNNKLYAIGQNNRLFKLCFHDIVTGNNSQSGVAGYNATQGWDAATGWGSPIASNLLLALDL